MNLSFALERLAFAKRVATKGSLLSGAMSIIQFSPSLFIRSLGKPGSAESKRMLPSPAGKSSTISREVRIFAVTSGASTAKGA